MISELIGHGQTTLSIIPAIVADPDDHAARRFLEFFTPTIRNKNIRKAYAEMVGDFLTWPGYRLDGDGW